MPPPGDAVAVQVALRVRPLVPSEIEQGCVACLGVTPGEPQVVVGGEKAFTFDHVFSAATPQEDVYTNAVQPLLEAFFAGFNTTVFAYGQTGSGKTHTMGTNAGVDEAGDDETGIIPRLVADLFARVNQEGDVWRRDVSVSFLEIHNDDIHDLLDQTPKVCTLREDAAGGVVVANLEEYKVTDAGEMLSQLADGSARRATASTCMNATSSRSHAVFTILMHSSKLTSSADGEEAGEADAFVSRLHLVDLAGSERAKRTKAEGARLKEGININKGLLALGNVISALSDEEKRKEGAYVPYRDSKLTRMLQDSLGGNSRTLMIACVSPADSNFEETVNTLKYAHRAKSIKNKAVVNREGPSAEVAALRAQVQALEAMLAGGGGAAPANGSLDNLPAASSAESQERIAELEREVAALKDEVGRKNRRALTLEIEADKLKLKLASVCKEHNIHLEDEKEAADASEGNADPASDGSAPDSEEQEPQQAPEEDGGMGWALSNAAMAEELHGIEEALDLKQRLLDQMTQGGADIEAGVDQAQMQTMQQTIDSLTNEREELLKLGNQASKVGDLEQQIASLRHKVAEQERLLKVKHLTDRRIGQLSGEIDSMKGAKVQLLRKIKTETEKFREWRAEHMKEVALLKRQRSQAEYQNHKLQAQMDKQAGVLKRKMEENSAANSRIKALLTAKSVAKGSKDAMASGAAAGKEAGDSLEAWLDAELKLCVEVRSIKALLSEQTAHRANLTREVASLTETLSKPASPPAPTDLKGRLASLQNAWKKRGAEPREETEGRLRGAQDQVQECSKNIGDLQRQLLEVEGNNDRERNVALNCPMLRSQQDAKRAVRVLFSVAARAQHRSADTEAKLAEASDAEATAEAKIELIKEKMQVQSRDLQMQAIHQEQEAEEKAFELIKMIASKPDAGEEKGGSEGGSGKEEVMRSLTTVTDERNELRKKNMVMEQNLEEAHLLLQAKPMTAAQNKKAQAKRSPVIVDSESEEDESEDESEAESDEDDWVPTENKKRNRQGAAKDKNDKTKGKGRASDGSEGSRDSEGGRSEESALSHSPVTINSTEKSVVDVDEILTIPGVKELQALTVPSLKDLCGQHGVKKGGKKEELVQRLRAKAQELEAQQGGSSSSSSSPGAPPNNSASTPVVLGAKAAALRAMHQGVINLDTPSPVRGDAHEKERTLSLPLSPGESADGEAHTIEDSKRHVGHVTSSRGSSARGSAASDQPERWGEERVASGGEGEDHLDVAVGVLRETTPAKKAREAKEAQEGDIILDEMGESDWTDAAAPGAVPSSPGKDLFLAAPAPAALDSGETSPAVADMQASPVASEASDYSGQSHKSEEVKEVKEVNPDTEVKEVKEFTADKGFKADTEVKGVKDDGKAPRKLTPWTAFPGGKKAPPAPPVDKKASLVPGGGAAKNVLEAAVKKAEGGKGGGEKGEDVSGRGGEEGRKVVVGKSGEGGKEKGVGVSSSVSKLEILSTNLDIASKHRQSPGADEKPRPAKHFGASSSSSQVRADAPKPTFSASSKPQATTSGPMRSLTAHKTSAIPPLASGSSAGVSDLKSRVASLATSVRVPLGAHKANLAGNSDNKAGSTIMKPSLPDKTASSTNLANKAVEKPGFGVAPKPVKPGERPAPGAQPTIAKIYRPPSMLHKVQRPAP